MAITRIKNNQITDSTVNAATKLQDFSITAGKIANNLTYGSDLTVAGNLSISGTTTTIDTTNLSVEDAILLFASGQTGSPTVDVGFIGERGEEDNVAFVWDESTDKFIAAFTTSSASDTSITIESYTDLEVADLAAVDGAFSGNVDITGDMTLTGNLDSLDVTGNVVAGNFTTTGVVDAGTVTASSTITATGNIDGGNLTTAGTTQTGSLSANTTITATGNVSGGNLTTAGTTQTGSLSANTTVSATGNVSGGNITTSGEVDATGNVSGGNLTTAGEVDATGNVSGGNLTTAGTTQTGDLTANTTISATGNVSGGNLTTSGEVDATGNVSGGNLVTAGTTQTGSLSANTTITATGNVSGGNLTTSGTTQTGSLSANTTVSATGNVSGGNITTSGEVDATGNVSGGNLVTSGELDAETVVANTSVTSPLITSDAGLSITTGADGDITLNPAGNGEIVLSDQLADSMVFTNANSEITTSTNASFDGGNLNITGAFGVDNVRIDDEEIRSLGTELIINRTNGDVDFIVSGSTNDNLFFVDSGTDSVVIGGSTTINGSVLNIDSTDSMSLPSGTTAERPASPSAGMFRYNSTLGDVEYYDGAEWVAAGTIFTVIESDTFSGDGSTTVYTLNESSTTAASIVSINGVVQLPTTAYAITGTTLTFTEAPESGDEIEVRRLTTTTSIAGIVNADTTAAVTAVDGAAQVNIMGNLIPTDDVTYNLGEAGNRWNDLYLSGTTINLGNIQIKETAGNSIGFFESDGTTPATIDASAEIVADEISSGNSNIAFASGGGNATVTVGGTANVGVFTDTGLVVTGSIEATNGFVGLDATTIEDGNSSVSVVSEDGNIEVTVDGTTASTFTSSGIDSDLVGNVTGDVTGTVSDISNHDTDDLSEGSNNLYFTTARVDSHLEGGTGVDYSTGTIAIGQAVGTTDNVTFNQVTITAAPTGPDQAAKKSYVDEVAQGLKARQAADVLADSNLTATYDNGTSGVGATLTSTSNGAFPTIDGVTLDTQFDRILVTGQSNAAHNGLYVLTVVGDGSNPWELTRCGTCNEDSEIPGSFVFVQSGTTYNTTGWVADVSDPSTFTIGTNDIDWVQFSGAGSFTAGSGLDLSGSIFSHTDTSSQASVNNSGLAVIQDVTLDGFGHVTGLASKTISRADLNIDTSDSVTFGEITVPSIAKSGTDGVGNIGSSANSFDTVHAKATSAQYADLAEMYVSDAEYAPGTVVAFGGQEEVTVSGTENDARIAGVISTNPSYLMNSTAEGSHLAAVALTGRVPTRVTGSVRKGDMMVSNGDGTARAESSPSIGTVIGKALEDFDGTDGVIEVVVGRL